MYFANCDHSQKPAEGWKIIQGRPARLFTLNDTRFLLSRSEMIGGAILGLELRIWKRDVI